MSLNTNRNFVSEVVATLHGLSERAATLGDPHTAQMLASTALLLQAALSSRDVPASIG